jgi:hypothetical protein
MAISMSAEKLPPGGALEIVGVGFASTETLQIQLVGPAGQWSLPDVTTDADGNFAVVLTVPADAGEGDYTIDAVSASGVIQRETFRVDRAAPAPALTPSPIAPSSRFGAIDLGGAGWVFVPLVVLAAVATAFVVLVVRRRPGIAVPPAVPPSGDV